MAQAGYAWTSAFLMMCFLLVGACWLMVAAAKFQTLVSVVLVGTAMVIVRTLVSVIAFDRSQFTSLASGNANSIAIMQQYISTGCPDYASRSLDESSGLVVCTNQVGNVTVGPKPFPAETRLSDIDPATYCATIANGTATAPWVAMKKYCEYAKLP
jgi:hypothetical protein